MKNMLDHSDLPRELLTSLLIRGSKLQKYPNWVS
jgi:hypothetical protein